MVPPRGELSPFAKAEDLEGRNHRCPCWVGMGTLCDSFCLVFLAPAFPPQVLGRAGVASWGFPSLNPSTDSSLISPSLLQVSPIATTFSLSLTNPA